MTFTDLDWVILFFNLDKYVVAFKCSFFPRRRIENVNDVAVEVFDCFGSLASRRECFNSRRAQYWGSISLIKEDLTLVYRYRSCTRRSPFG